MNRFKKILFVADGAAGEKTALTKTIQLAMDIKAKISVIDVIVPAENFAITDVAANMIKLQKEMLKVRKDELASLVKSARLRNSTLPIPVMLKEGKDFIEIIRTVQQDGFDLGDQGQWQAASYRVAVQYPGYESGEEMSLPGTDS